MGGGTRFSCMRIFWSTLYVVVVVFFFFAFFAHLLDWIMLILVWFERTLHLAQVGWQLMLSLMTSQTVECTGDLGKNGLIKRAEIPDSHPPCARLHLTPNLLSPPKHINSDLVRVCWNTSVRLLPIFSPNLALYGQIWLFYPRGGGTWVNFCWVCAAGLSEPLPYYSLFCGHLSHFGKQVIFAIPT